MSAEQLKACAADTLEMARGLGERVTVAGFSLGGLLSAYLGQFNEVQRVVAIAPFLGVVFVPSAFRLRLANWLLHRRNRFYWWDPLLRERQLPEHGYPRYASHAVAHSLTIADELLNEAGRQAPKASEIVLVVNAREPAVNNRAIMNLVQKWRAHTSDVVHVHRLTGLPIAHDIIEPKRYPDIARRVLPVLVELIDP